MARRDPQSKLDRRPITTLRGRRLHAWLFALMAATVAVMAVFMPVLMATADDEDGFATALAALYGGSPFILILPGLFVATVYLAPIWLILRFWIARQKDRPTGNRPATLPVWLAIWMALTVVQVLVTGEDNLVAPPGPLALIPAPFSWPFNGMILVQMAGVAVMFLFYRRARPQDAGDVPSGPGGPVQSR